MLHGQMGVRSEPASRLRELPFTRKFCILSVLGNTASLLPV